MPTRSSSKATAAAIFLLAEALAVGVLVIAKAMAGAVVEVLLGQGG